MTTDLNGEPRFVDDAGTPDNGDPGSLGPPIVDMGAYERQTDSTNVTLTVPSQVATIQAAIDIACAGTEIILEPGTYNEAIDFGGKAVTIRSTDPDDADVVAATVLDGTGLGTNIVTFRSGEDRASVLRGLTLRNGSGAMTGSAVPGTYSCADGFGFDCATAEESNGTATLIFDPPNKNQTRTWVCYTPPCGLSTVLTTFRVECDPCAYGWQLFVYTDCPDSGGTQLEPVAYSGGPVYELMGATTYVIEFRLFIVFPGPPAIWTFTATCTPADDGGGVVIANSSPSLVQCAIVDCTSKVSGGGVAVSGAASAPLFQQCTFRGNFAFSGGAIFLADDVNASIEGCSFVANSAADTGGAIHATCGSPPCDHTISIGSSTLTGNSAANGGGAISVETFPMAVSNSIVWDNAPDGILGLAAYQACDVQGGIPPGSISIGGNIDADPAFVDADGADDVPGTADDDLRLGAGSPCIDAGYNFVLPADTFDLDGDGDTDEPLPYDLAGADRLVDDPGTVDTGLGGPPVVDIGAYEFDDAPVLCAGDLTGPLGKPDGNVDSLDFLVLIGQWGSPCVGECTADVTGPGEVPDGNVDSLDFLLLISQWGSPASCGGP
jgi:predicted outer membrane repeat protein